MNDYTKTVLLSTLTDKYPGYLFEIEDNYPSTMVVIRIKSRSSGLERTEFFSKDRDILFIDYKIKRTINIMREKELESVTGWSGKNMIGYYGMWPGNKYYIAPKEVIFQDKKATIINWTDGTKTIVKCSDDDVFSPEAGVALCYMKKFVTDNDSERFHRFLKSLISVAKFKNSKKNYESSLSDLFDYAEVIKGYLDYIDKLRTTEENHDIDTGASDNSGDNDPDGSAVEVES
jgi:hypothetical protein